MILASASPRRRELLGECGIAVSVQPADIDEHRLPDESPVSLVRRLACQKAQAAYEALDNPLDEPLIAADTIVWDESGDVLGKPLDQDDAARMLRLLSGRSHYVSTGVCIMAPGDDEPRQTSFVETTEVVFRDLTESEIAAYVASGEPMDKAGAYGIQGRGRLLVLLIRGDYPNVVGLPVNRTLRELDALCGGTTYVTRALGGSHE